MEDQKLNPGPPSWENGLALLFRIGRHGFAVGPALTLALAVVLALGGPATALAFAGVLAFTGVFFFLALGSFLAGFRCRCLLRVFLGVAAGGRRRLLCHSVAGNKSGQCGSHQQCTH